LKYDREKNGGKLESRKISKRNRKINMKKTIKKNKPPRWLELQVQIDYLLWELNNLYEETKMRRSPIENMIDEATGIWKKKTKEAEKIMATLDKLKKEYYRELAPSTDTEK
jgi:hypothetical protein